MSANEKDWIAQWALLASTTAPSPEEQGGRTSRVECYFTDANFWNIHLPDCSAEGVRQQLMPETDAEIRLSSFAHP